jgi:hypothetical protein
MKARRLSAIPIAFFLLQGGAVCNGGPTGGGTTPPVGGNPPGSPGTPITIEEPRGDSIAVTSTIDARGAGAAGASVSVDVNGLARAAEVIDDRWHAPEVPLPGAPLNVLRASKDSGSVSVLVTKAPAIAARPAQRFRFDWTSAADEQLARIADDTLDASLTPGQRSVFVTAVKARMEAILITRYDSWDVELVDTAGPDVHTIKMLGYSGGIFGQSPYDCGNTALGQESEVWVGTYRQSMSNVANWRPMRRVDSLAVRIEDVAQALARTSAHELGHSVGLVGEGTYGCGWMLGCDGGHNCDVVDQQQALADRFDQGRYIMDPGQKTSNHARLAEPTVQRAVRRSPARFNDFSGAYLTLVHSAP